MEKQTKITDTKAYEMLSKAKTVQERAVKYVERIKKSLEMKILTKLEEDIEKVNDKIFELSNFSLDEDSKITKESCENRFIEILNLEYEKELLQAEYEVKKRKFEELFSK